MSRWLRVLLIVGAAACAFYGLRPPGVETPPHDSSEAAAGATQAGPGMDTAAGQRAAKERDLDLPPEARATIAAIERGGPFEYERDGVVFQNREGRLPARPRGYYREYTVKTPGSRDRGARRIVAGGQPPEVFYFSDDHYATFRRVEEPLP
jgi:guanyl-specific ribonuclease Sa